MQIIEADTNTIVCFVWEAHTYDLQNLKNAWSLKSEVTRRPSFLRACCGFWGEIQGTSIITNEASHGAHVPTSCHYLHQDWQSMLILEPETRRRRGGVESLNNRKERGDMTQ
jgi:hypothetical protein